MRTHCSARTEGAKRSVPTQLVRVMEGFQRLLKDMMGSQLTGKKTTGKAVLGRESSVATMTESGSIEHHRWLTMPSLEGRGRWGSRVLPGTRDNLSEAHGPGMSDYRRALITVIASVLIA